MDISESLRRILEEKQKPLSDRFYRLLFDRHPDMQPYFRDVDLRFQGAMLTMALQLVVQQYAEPKAAVGEYLLLLGHKHHVRGIPREAYPRFIETLIATLGEFHGSDWDTNLAEQWQTAIQQAVAIMTEGHVPGTRVY
jgi:hemoglobin-like flavoprotein